MYLLRKGVENVSLVSIQLLHYGMYKLILILLFQRANIVIQPAALLTPSRHLLTNDPLGQTKGWAPIRSRDNIYSFGTITHQSKFLMAQNSGMCLDIVNEVEQRHNTTMQCPYGTREGNRWTIELISLTLHL